MSDLKYTVIKNDEQYNKYCNQLEALVSSGLDNQEAIDEYGLNQTELAEIADVGKKLCF